MMSVLRDENCALVGGHTAEGHDLAVGLSVNGVVDSSRVLKKGPPQIGHVLILTKGIGIGTLFAADMRVKAKGKWISNAIQSMLQSNRKAAEIIYEFGKASACTDITGFGLIGHLLEMIQYNYSYDDIDTARDDSTITDYCQLNVQVHIYLSKIPILDGAIDCVQAGILSSLQSQNTRCAKAIANVDIGEKSNVYPLLFDPQVSKLQLTGFILI